MINEHIEDLYKLSPVQHGILFHSLYNPRSGMYFEQFGWHMRGILDVAVFTRTWQYVLDRHPILRTAFYWKDLPEPLQMVHRTATLPVDVLDWSDLPHAEQEARLEQLFDDDRLRGFDLTVPPLIRLTLVRLEPELYQVLWSYHHLLLDGWSVALLMEEIPVVYEALSAGRHLRLERRRPYREYIGWLRQRDLAQAEAFWRRVLQGFAEPTALGGQMAWGDADGRPEAYGLQILTLPAATMEGLQALTRRYQVTLNTLAQGAWALLLSRYSGKDDVVFGTTVSGRPPDLPGSRAMIGLFINTLPVRVRLPAGRALEPWLQEIQTLLVELRQYEYSPLVEVHGWSDVPRGQPLFDSILVFENYRVDETARMRNIKVFQKNNYPLTVVVEPGATLSLRIGYDTHRFDAPAIARMLQHMRTVLESFVADPDQRLADVPLLGDDERQQLLVAWNDTDADYPDGPAIAQVFEAQAAYAPDAVALVCPRAAAGRGDDAHLTYGELNARASRLAYALREFQVGPERPVGIYMERSPEMIVAVLGTLKAGGVYVPLDPGYPQDRLAFMFADTRMSVLVTRRQLADGLSERPPHVVCMDSDWATLAQAGPDPVCAAVTPANAMYVLYTSGSTGRPKGVVVEQRQVLNYVRGILERLDGIPGVVTAMVQPLAVDSCVTAIYPPLCSGGRLHIIPESIALDPIALSAYFDRCPVDCLKIAPSHLAALQSGPRPERLLPRRQLIIGGEASQWSWVAQLRALAPACAIVNHYGPTEATVGMLTYRVGPPAEDQVGALPLGRPLPNTRAYVLDRWLRPVPVGVPGELYIGGACLARSYFNRPDLTAAAFIPNPFDDERRTTNDERQGDKQTSRQGDKEIGQSPISNLQSPNNRETQHSTLNTQNSRLYKTGDLVRYRADGNIEFLGRADDQIKIRGFRVELGEIEAQIRQHPAVREAVVAIHEDAGRHRQLVAYVVPTTDHRPTTNDQRQGDKETSRQADKERDLSAIGYRLSADRGETQHSTLNTQNFSSILNELRDFLGGKLPEYMVPTSFMLLEALPLTPHGKLDRRALPAPDVPQPDSDGKLVAPRTPVEELLAQIWTDVLRVPQVGADDSFFALGGHSLMATQLISRVHAAFHVELPLRSLFEARTVAGMARRIEAARRAHQGLAPPPIHAIPRTGNLPLSFAQQRLWFLDQIEPDSPTYNIPAAVRLSGCLDVCTLQRSIDAIVARHEVLRTTIAAVDGRPVQVIAPASSVPLPVADLRALPADQRENAARRLAFEVVRGPFDLARGPLIRAALLRLADDEQIMLLTVHHIVFDGWSMGVFVRELATLYGAISAGQPALLPGLALQYVDFVAWQREWLQGAVLEQQLAYWTRQIADLPVLELPTDYPRPPVPSFRGQIFAFTLPEELMAAIAALNRREETTLFMLLLAAFQTLLYRYTGQEDVGVGTPIAGRTRPETEQLIGCFINMQVLRTSLAGNPTFRELLGRVRETALDAYAHQDLPFERLVEELHLERDLGRSPLFHVLFSLQNTPLPDLALPGLTLRPLGIDNQTAKYDLTLAMQETRQGVVGQIEYKTDLFDAATIARMAGHFQTILQSAVAGPDRRIADLALLTDAEREQMLVEWNSLTIEYPAGRSIHACVEEQVARAPDVVAVLFQDQHLTFGELNRRANRVAHHVRALGVGPDTRVAIGLDRSLDMVVGLLGILKAGGAYVPLDPAYPPERLAFMLEDAQVSVLVTQARLLPALPAQGLQVVLLDADRERIAAQPEQNPRRSSAPENLAYVIYTSGSTGAPKGVMIDHQALVDHSYAVIKRCDMQPDDRLLQFASLNSDIAVEDLFPTWISGAAVVLWPDLGAAAFDTFSRFAERERLTVLNLPTAYWHEWVLALEATATPVAPSLRLVIVGGEKALAERLAIWRRLAGGRVRWSNAYGPTEATISTTIYEPALDDEEIARLRAIPIGRPIANTQIYLLDQHMQPVPAGIPGELHIGGARLARGYLNRPDLTAERFVPNPFADERRTTNDERRQGDKETRRQGDDEPATQHSTLNTQHSRLYKTGDLARYWPDGNIEFLGRADHQVKVRGFRIELREIETALGEHQGVRDAVVLAREDTPGERRLVAYVVLSQDPAPTTSELRRFLKERLPDHMLPTSFVALDALPLTPGGKVDLRALPVPDAARPALDDAFVAPRTPIEAALAGIWAEVLRLEQVGVHDNFFALGGDSILTIQIIARANQAGLQLIPRNLFQHQTIAALAAVVDTAPAAVATQDLVIGAVPLTPIEHWFFAQDLPDPHHYNQDVMLELLQPLDEALLAQTIQHLIVHHDALRLRFRRGAGGWQQTNAGVVEQPVLARIDLSAVPPEQQSAAITAAAAELQASLNLTDGPLVGVGLFDCGAGRRGRLLLIVHHLAVDGVSWRVLLEDLQTVYTQLSRGAEVALPPKTTAFKAWAERLVAYAQSAAMRQELAYWLAMPWSRVARLPLDHPGDANTMASARVVTVTLGAEETRALLREVPQAYHTQINDVLMTALAQALAPWIGTSAVLVHLEGHGREDLFADVDLSRTVGWFTSIFPVLLDLDGADRPELALKAIKEQLRRLPRRGVGFGILRYLSEDPQIAGQMRTLPQAEVGFNYLGQVDQVLPSEGLFGPAREASGPTQSPLGRRNHLLDVGGLIVGGQLHIRWTYSDTLHERATIEALARRFLAALQALIAHCRSPEAGGYTPSDFPLARIDQAALDRLIGSGRQVEDLYALTPLQEGMLFHTLHDTRPGMYIEQLSFPLYGALDAAALARAWQQVVDRHVVFRTAFFWEGLKAPVQIVYHQVRQPWIEDDWRGLPPGDQEARLNVFLADDRRRGFALSQAPLMRLALFRTSDDSYEFVWSCHHMLLDGWSLPIVLDEVFALYAAVAHGRRVQLARPRPYRDYIAWLKQQDLGRAEAFWRGALAGFKAPTVLAIDRPTGPEARASGFGEQKLQLAEPATAALLTLARQHGLTANTILQGAWALLLSRYSGAQDVVFGTTVAGRPADLAGAETMVGLFINTLPVRVGVPPEAASLPWLQRLQDQLAELRQYEYSPLVAIQGWSDVPRGRPLFESIVVFENYPLATTLSAQGERTRLKSQKVRVVERTNYALTLTAGVDRELSLRMIYDSSRFEVAAIARLLGHMAALLQGIAAAPTARLADLPLLTQEEWQQIRSWNATATATVPGRCVHHDVEAQAARTPDALALVFADQHLTYAELNRRANQLAHQLRSHGVGPDARVGVCLERSPEMVVAVLAALKAGAAYVPLDPEYPQERLSFMLDDARVPILLAGQRQHERLPSHAARVICIDAAPADAACVVNPDSGALPDHLAYVIYTSGSTGRPKGVAMSHRPLANLLAWQQRSAGLQAGARTLQFAPLSFDVSFQEIFTTLGSGGTLILIDEETRRDTAALARLLDTAAAERLFLPFIALQQLAMAIDGGAPAPSRLREIMTAGEQLQITQPILHTFARLAGCALYNQYGPSEGHVVTAYTLPGALDDWPALPPIGRPIDNARIELLDLALQPVPIGVPGELHIGGVSLARGYLDRPDLTAERFIPDPFGGVAGARLYKTGDLARYRSDGTIAFLGRIDHQIKLRGFRIELGEIEVALGQHPSVHEAVVLARTDRPGDTRLVAYVVPKVEDRGLKIEDSQADAPEKPSSILYPLSSELRAFLKKKLPEYMLPSAFVLLDTLPLTPNGKIDRMALLAPDQARPHVEAPFEAPRTPVEETLAAIWSDVLGVSPISIHDNFFVLGGHSLLATQVVSRVRAELLVELSVRTIFAEPTLASLADAIVEMALEQADSELLMEMMANLPTDAASFS